MSNELRQLLEHVRRVIIELLGLLDDTLGLQRTVPSKEDRHLLRKLKETELRHDRGF